MNAIYFFIQSALYVQTSKILKGRGNLSNSWVQAKIDTCLDPKAATSFFLSLLFFPDMYSYPYGSLTKRFAVLEPQNSQAKDFI